MPDAPFGMVDFDRMIRARVAKVRAAMEESSVATLICCGQNNVSYLTAARPPSADAARASAWRAVAVLRADEPRPRLFTQFPQGARPGPVIEEWLAVETAEGAQELVALLGEGPIALDDAPFPLWTALAGRSVCDASAVLGPAKLTKTEDELRCIEIAQRINEEAMQSVRPLARPGVKATTVSGAFLRAVAERGATANTVDPVFQVMPHTVETEATYPTPTQPIELQTGDVVWVDTGINYEGYASDFGATWIVGRAPDAVERDQYERWRGVVDGVLDTLRPGVTGGDLVRAAGKDAGRTPWLSYFYLAHGIGCDSAEMPFVGTDLGPDFDDALVMQPGMVLVLEPVIWDNGHAGHRSEEIVAVTDTGYRRLSRTATLDEGSAWLG
jgi:Xaa-Pro dipeptidase